MKITYPYSFGSFPSPHDYRDIPLSALSGEPQALPPRYFVDLNNIPIWAQKRLGACVGHAGAKYKQVLDEKETKTVFPLSARFLYAVAKCQDGIKSEGTYPRLVAKILKDYGCATEKTVPNNTDLDHETYVYNRKLENILSDKVKEDAKPYQIEGYAFPAITAEGLKEAIYKFQGAMVLMRLGEEWWTDEKGIRTYDPLKLMPIRPPKVVISGHEVYFYGYETLLDGQTRFWFLNSWTENWGIKGVGYITFEEYKDFIDEAITFIDKPNDWFTHVQNLPPSNQFKYEFKQDIEMGDISDEVKNLQIALKIDGEFPTNQKITGYYGPITQQAVKMFQKKYKVASLWELLTVNGKRVGPKTRSKLNELFNK